ncbi:MAG: sensor histidine kinase KdpD [Candidatus Melainabacteria bacterium]|nr:MAG: sensor histidine kinase KdpD [Candidatus Melainabacteria bacterium]
MTESNKAGQDSRPDPDLLLTRIKEEDARSSKGRLKVFFGAVAGVGKTYAMLETAHKLQDEGIDVVLGVVETHKRAETEALVEGLEYLQKKQISYRGTTMEEFDIDLALRRKPEIILVDELAHTNAPGSRHLKRWQDVEELLDNGIDVYTTLNVQHIESLHDVVAQITGVTIQERIPDSFLEKTFEIELIDLPPDELIQRLKDGKVYLTEQIDHALTNFFQKGNLIALRELALRAAAERVDAQMEQYRKSHQVKRTWPAAEKILVCVSSSPLSIRLVRAAKRMANGLKAKWVVANVETPRQSMQNEKDRARVIRTLKLAQQLGAEIVELTGKSVSHEVMRYAKQNNITKIIVGKPAKSRLRDLIYGSALDDLIRDSGSIDVYVITGEKSEKAETEAPQVVTRSKPRQYLMGILVVAICTIIAKLTGSFFEFSTIIMGYMLGVIIVALLYGRGPSILVSFLSVAVFDFLFVPPHFTFAVSDAQYLITFVVMLIVALTISTLMVEIKQQAETARQREKKTAALYSLSRELGSITDLKDLVKTGLKHVGEVFNGQVAIFLASENEDNAKLELFSKGEGAHSLSAIDEGVANWAFKNRKAAGLGTDTLPSASALYIPLLGSKQTIGVLAVKPNLNNPIFYFDQLHLLETFANQIAIACERAYFAQENEKTRVMMKTEQLRSSLLSSVSHDLRTPLATITGAASSIMEGSKSLSLSDCRILAGEIYNESVRLNTLVKNLLDMTRLQSGTLKVRTEWYPIDEIIGAAIATITDAYQQKKHKINTQLPDQIPLVPLDAILIQQVLFNLIDNAFKYSKDSAELDIIVQTDAENVKISVCDRGIGISDKNKEKVFHKFFQEEQSLKTGIGVGAGLGLAIASGIIEAHGGRIWVEDRKGGGSIFNFTLPLADNSGDLPKKPEIQ